MAELSLEAGIPAGALNVVTGPGETTGKLVGLHPGIDAVSFTGSSETDRKFLEYSAKNNLKRVTLECGSKSPAIVLDDAEHLGDVARHVATGASWNMGENCTANSRLIVDRRVKDDLFPRVLEKARDWRLRDPLDPASALGALVSAEHCAKVADHLAEAVRRGAKVLSGCRTWRICRLPVARFGSNFPDSAQIPEKSGDSGESLRFSAVILRSDLQNRPSPTA